MHVRIHTHDQYLSAEVLELSGNVAKGAFVTPEHIRVAVQNDKELKTLLVSTVASSLQHFPGYCVDTTPTQWHYVVVIFRNLA